MHTPPPNLIRVVERAAELRAAGHSWDHVAREVGRPARTVRDWPRRYPEFWRRIAGTTRRDALEEAGVEALALLRKQLRAEDDKVVREAAKLILAREAAAAPAAAEAEPRPDLVRFVEYLEGLSDADLDALLGPTALSDAPRPEDRETGTADPPGPA